MKQLMTADLIVITHFSFILFVIFGGFLVMKWRTLIWLHIPAVVWGVLLELFSWVCPLTTLENKLRNNQEGETYASGFIEHYIIPVIYPDELTREIQIVLGIAVFFLNLFIYIGCFKKWAIKSEKDNPKKNQLSKDFDSPNE